MLSFRKILLGMFLTFLLVILVIAGYSSITQFDEISLCERTISTDKKEYFVGDSMRLTFNITPIDTSATLLIRTSNKIQNISIWMNKYPGVINPGSKEDEVPYNDITVSRTKPFRKTFHGIIRLEDENYIIEFPDLGRTFRLPSAKYGDYLEVWVSAHYQPIKFPPFSSLEDYFQGTEIIIRKSR